MKFPKQTKQTMFAGIDIGGSAIKCGLFNLEGDCLETNRIALDKTKQAEEGLEKVIATIEQWKKQYDNYHLQSVGIGIPGIIDQTKGCVIDSGNLKNWIGFPVRQFVSESLGVEVCFDNDANMAAYGEYLAGAGQGGNSMALIILGTGVGSAFVIDGRIFEMNGFSPELGHTIVDYNGYMCDCGRKGCLETFISINGLKKTLSTILKEAKANEETEKRYKQYSPEELSELAAQSDAIAIKTYKLAGNVLGIAIANLLNLMRFDRIVIAGGISNAWEGFYCAVNDTVAHYTFDYHADRISISKASLGDKAGMIGAGLAAIKKYIP